MSVKILLISDNRLDANKIKEYLSSYLPQKINLTSCKSYEEAFAPLFLKEWDMVLINSELRGRGALTTLEKINGILVGLSTRVVLFNMIPSQRENFLKAGANAFLFKEDLNDNKAGLKLLGELCEQTNSLMV